MLEERGPTARLVAGGTDVALHPPAGVTTLIDVGGLPLASIEERDGAIHLGGLATLTNLLEHPATTGYLDGVIPQMLVHVGSPLLRNVATLGGHLARGRLSDVVPVLLAVEATITVYSGEERTVPLVEFYETELFRLPGIITRVTLPAPTPCTSAAFRRFSRTGFDLAMLNCAVLVQVSDGTVNRARIAVGETPRLARLVPAAHSALEGSPLTPAAIAAAAHAARETVQTGDDQRAGAAYRSQLVRVGVERCLGEAAGRLEGCAS